MEKLLRNTTHPFLRQAVRDALIAFMAATAQVQAEATKAAQRGDRACQAAWRPRLHRPQAELHARTVCPGVRYAGAGSCERWHTSQGSWADRQTVYRIKGDPPGAEAALVAWGM
jgi:putative DNA-invertase from lambdoid prophage Rac